MSIINESLQIQPFIPETESYPTSSEYINYDNIGTNQRPRFVIRSPGKRALLDSEVWISYQIYLLGTKVPGITLNLIFDQPNQDALFPKQGFLLPRTAYNWNVNINNIEINESFVDYYDEILRFYATKHEDETIFTMSGGEIDKNHGKNLVRKHYGKVPNTLPQPNPFEISTVTETNSLNLFSGIQINSALPLDGETLNRGAIARDVRFREEVSTALNLSNTPAFPVSFFNTFQERLIVPPFYAFESRDTKSLLPHVRDLLIEFELPQPDSKLLWNGLFAGYPEQINPETDISLEVRNFQIKCKWVYPPDTMKIPKLIPMPMVRYHHYVKEASGFYAIPLQAICGPQIELEFDNLRLQQIPDRLFVYVNANPRSYNYWGPTMLNFTITGMKIRLNGDDGKIIRYGTQELYRMYVKNSPSDINHSLSSWERYFCVICLQPEDYGVHNGPGINKPALMTITVEALSCYKQRRNRDLPPLPNNIALSEAEFDWWNDLQPRLNIVAEYRKYRIDMKHDMPSRFYLQGHRPGTGGKIM